ncbi:hypothetical protein V6Z11_A10G250300, partial [Gossypium hirsutum]
MKLLIHSKSHRFQFAGDGKDFVDFFFNIMSLPVGTVIRLLSEQGRPACIRNIYNSIENLGNSYMLSATNKDILLKPQAFNYAVYVPPLLPSMKPPTYTNFYRCTSSYPRDSCCMANVPKSRCPCCTSVMDSNFTFANLPNKVGGGFVKETLTYMITDDLVVRPLPTQSIITLLNKFNIKDVVKEKVIAVGVNEGKKKLKYQIKWFSVHAIVFL